MRNYVYEGISNNNYDFAHSGNSDSSVVGASAIACTDESGFGEKNPGRA